MPDPTGNVIVDAEIQAVTDAEGAMDSAIALIGTIAAKIQAGIDAALAGGASAAQLSSLTTLQADLVAKTKSLADAVAANA